MSLYISPGSCRGSLMRRKTAGEQRPRPHAAAVPVAQIPPVSLGGGPHTESSCHDVTIRAATQKFSSRWVSIPQGFQLTDHRLSSTLYSSEGAARGTGCISYNTGSPGTLGKGLPKRTNPWRWERLSLGFI